MKPIIRNYVESSDYSQLTKLIESEGDEWKEYLKPNYKKALVNSITFVAFVDDHLCGFCRAINDSDLFIWIIDLLVDKNFRGLSIGKQLMERIAEEHPNNDVYVMSDVDSYYEKCGYQKAGSIYKISRTHNNM